MSIEETYSDDGLECPYCNNVNHVEGEDQGSLEGGTEWDCADCGKKFDASCEYSVSFTARAKPCKNHKWEEWVDGTNYRFRDCENCSETDTIKIKHDEEAK